MPVFFACTYIQIVLCLIFSLDLSSQISALRNLNKVLRVEDSDTTHSYYVADFVENSVCRIPDVETLKIIVHNSSEIQHVSSMYLNSFRMKKESLPSLASIAQNPDDKMSEIVRTVETMQPSNFIVGGEIKLPFPAINPAIELWGDVLFVSYREGIWQFPIKIFWMYLKDAEIGNFEKIKYIDIKIKSSGFDDFAKEDPRLILRPDAKSLVMIYTAKREWNTAIRQHLVILNILRSVSDAGEVKIELEASDPCVLDDKVKPLETKNWIALHDEKHNLHLIEEIKPMHLVSYGENCSFVNTTIMPRFGLYVTHEHHKRPRSVNEVPVPWRQEYGTFLKGGTPAIMLNGHYLAFFHSDSSHTQGMTTYYMGAISFCPQFPYSIQSMSEYAILKPAWYEGEWSHSARDYVVFPMAIIRHPDGKHLLLSMGRQDKYGYIVKVDILGLLKSLREVQACPPYVSFRAS